MIRFLLNERPIRIEVVPDRPFPLAKAVAFQERAENRRAREKLSRTLSRELSTVMALWRGEINLTAIAASSVIPGAQLVILDDMIQTARLQARIGAVIAESLDEAVKAGIEIGAQFAPTAIAGLDLELARGAALSFIETQSLLSAQGITQRTAESMKVILGDLLTGHLTPTETARRLGQVAGLTTRGARAVENFRSGLVAQLIPAPEADTLAIRTTIETRVGRFRDRKLRERGMAIAETEIQQAIQEGEAVYYETAIDEGLIQPEEIVSIWQTVQDAHVCPICRPLHGKIVGFAQSFSSPAADELIARPPAHVRCRCFLRRVLVDSTTGAIQPGPR